MAGNPSAQVRITNRNNQWLVRDKYAGESYEFRPGETVTVAAEVAEHIFGYGLDEKGRWKKFLRMGIANHKDGKNMWNRIEMKPVGNIAFTGAVRQAA
jgi:hypothetical protein